MPRPQRIQYQGAFFHIYNRGVDKCPIVNDENDRRMFIHLLSEAVETCKLRLIAYCLMTNHFHFFLQQTSEIAISQALWRFGYQYVRFFNSKQNRLGPLFQNRFQSRIVDADAYATHLIRYIHLNPVHAGLVANPEQFLWSSYPCYVGILPRWPWLDIEWGLRMFNPRKLRALSEFRAFHQAAISERELKVFSNAKVHLFRKDLLGAGPLKGPGT